MGVDRIAEMLDEDELERAREHACWALMYLGERASEAVPDVEAAAGTDPSERVREVAEMALDKIEDDRDQDWRV